MYASRKRGKQPGHIGPAIFKAMIHELLDYIETSLNNPVINGKINASIWALTVTGAVLKEIHFNEILTAISLISASAASFTTILVQLKNLYKNNTKK